MFFYTECIKSLSHTVYLLETLYDINYDNELKLYTSIQIINTNFLFSFDIYFNIGLVILFFHFEWEVFKITLDTFVSPCATNKTLGIKNSVLWVRSKLIFGSISNETITFSSECYI